MTSALQVEAAATHTNAGALQPNSLDVGRESRPTPLPVPNPTQSFWLSLEANPLAKAGSAGALTADADICIIGSGITGVSAAYHLTRLWSEQGVVPGGVPPLKIVILEARDFCEKSAHVLRAAWYSPRSVFVWSTGSGATGQYDAAHASVLQLTCDWPGRNGGHLTPIYFQLFNEYAAAHGTEDAVRAIALEQYVASSLVDLLHSTGKADKVDLVAGGRVYLLMSEDQEACARADYDAAKAAGVDVSAVRFLGKEEVLTVRDGQWCAPGFVLTMTFADIRRTVPRCINTWTQPLAAQARYAALQPGEPNCVRLGCLFSHSAHQHARDSDYIRPCRSLLNPSLPQHDASSAMGAHHTARSHQDLLHLARHERLHITPPPSPARTDGHHPDPWTGSCSSCGHVASDRLRRLRRHGVRISTACTA